MALFDMPINLSLLGDHQIQIATGSPFGSAQYEIIGNSDTVEFLPKGTAALEVLSSSACCKLASLVPGDVVGPGASFASGGLRVPSAGLKRGTEFFGLEFDISAATTTAALDPFGYGTIRNGELISITYDPSGGPVTVQATPEPASLGLLAMGGAAVLALRRRRTASA